MRLVSVLAFTISLLGSGPLLAQDLHPETMAVLEVLAERLETDQEATYYQIYKELEPDLIAATQTDPAFVPTVSAIRTEVTLGESAAYVHGIAELLGYANDEANQAEIASYAVAVASIYPPGLSPSPLQLATLGEQLALLDASGVSRDDVLSIAAEPDLAATTYDAAVAAYNAGSSPAELEQASTAHAAAGALAFAGAFPGVGPGPLPVALTGLILDQAADGLDLATAGLDLSSQEGGPTQEQIDQLNTDIDAWADPLGEIREGLGEWAKPQKGLDELLADLIFGNDEESGEGEDDLPEQCRPINCDCENLVAVVARHVYLEQCYGEEDKLRQSCRASGAVSGICDPVASGPTAFPK